MNYGIVEIDSITLLKLFGQRYETENMYRKVGKISAQPGSHTKFDSIFHTNHLIVASGAFRYW